MSVKLIVDVRTTGETGVDFKFEIDDSQLADELEREVVECMAAACLNELQCISSHIGGTVIEGDDGR